MLLLAQPFSFSLVVIGYRTLYLSEGPCASYGRACARENPSDISGIPQTVQRPGTPAAAMPRKMLGIATTTASRRRRQSNDENRPSAQGAMFFDRQRATLSACVCVSMGERNERPSVATRLSAGTVARRARPEFRPTFLCFRPNKNET